MKQVQTLQDFCLSIGNGPRADGGVFRSLLVDQNSATPYSDATQVKGSLGNTHLRNSTEKMFCVHYSQTHRGNDEIIEHEYTRKGVLRKTDHANVIAGFEFFSTHDEYTHVD